MLMLLGVNHFCYQEMKKVLKILKNKLKEILNLYQKFKIQRLKMLVAKMLNYNMQIKKI